MKNSRFNFLISVYVFLIPFLFLGCGRKYHLERGEMNKISAWPFYRGGLSSSGAIPEGSYTGKLDILWQKKSNDKPAGPLTIYNNCLIYPGTRNKIKFFDLNNGDYLGYIKPRGTPQSGLVIKDSLAYYAVSPKKNKLKCINLIDGNLIWERIVKEVSSGSIIVNNQLIIGSGNGLLSAFDIESGSLVWDFKAHSKFTLPVTMGAGKLFQPGDNGILYVLSVDDGTELYEIELDNPLVSPVTAADLVYVVDVSGIVYGIDMADGSIIWRNIIGKAVWSALTVADNRLYIGNSNGEMTAIDASDGKVIWSFKAATVIRSSAIVIGDYVVFGTLGGELYLLSTNDGTMIEKRQLDGPLVSSPVTDGERIYVATEKGMITCFGEIYESEKTAE